MRVNWENVEGVATSLKAFGLRSALLLEEKLDPQFSAINALSSRIGKGYSAAYALAVSLISYKLAMKGEDWWACFSSFFSEKGVPKGYEELISNVVDFVNSCKGSIIGRERKLKRVHLFFANGKEIVLEVIKRPEIILESPSSLLKGVARSVNSSEWRKTVTFSIKMAYYAVKERGEMKPLYAEVPIPMDSRVSCITYTSALVDSKGYKEIISNPRPAIEAWKAVSARSGIPPVHLDTLLWTTGWAPRDLSPDVAKERVAEVLSRVSKREVAISVAKRLIKRPCK
ncbi:MAG: N-glycosylase/DNA lyase [Caldisphaeraceae archaeon]|nr:N-glycosylase/DNA lyase [Caldisphaeraceae archaeon]MEB3797304.1 N-glycosylase/DNA lyase [Caldisphaeraceae archaeon]